MTTRGSRSVNSSPSTSPDTYPDHYDPFIDPIELSSVPRRESDEDDRNHTRTSASPVDSASRYLPTGVHLPASRSRPTSQYAPLSGQDEGTSRASTIQDRSMFSLNSLQHYQTKDADTQRLVDRRAGEIAEWSVHWMTPAIIIVLFVAGVAGALGHHFFYAHLDGKPAADQLLMIRYGTALAFFTKSTLVGCVIMCYRQRIWRTFRRKAMTISAIDGLFAVTEDPTQFWNWEMIRNSKLATFMAACSWLIPIASVLSPASLTSEIQTSLNSTICPNVASLDFSHEATYNFRKESQWPGSSLAYYNTTDVKGEKEGYFDYFDRPSKNAKRLAITAAYLKKPAQFQNASLNFCGEGWNCTYSLNFEAPGYKCDDFTDNIASEPNAPFNLSILAPRGDYIYYGSVDVNDYEMPQVPSTDKGEPEEGPPYPEHMGVFQSEPVLWIGYANKTDKKWDSGSPYAGSKWKTVHEPKLFKCELYRTNYTFDIRYNDTNQITKRAQRDFLRRIVNTTASVDTEDSSKMIARPKENFVRPDDHPKQYKVAASYHALGALFRNFLRGDISYTDDEYFITKSEISETKLMDAQTSYPLPNLVAEMQNLFEDILITLLSEPHLVVAAKATVPCTRSQTANVYVYHRESLWIGYAFVVAATLGFICIGAWSIWQNGVSSDTQFSRIMATTRNPTIDRLSVGACLGGDPFPKELCRTKLRFGVLLEEDPRDGPLGKVEHCCFGTEGETKEIVKFGTYAGLKEWREKGEEENEETVGLLEKERWF